MVDVIYTPSELADSMVSMIPSHSPEIAVDIAAGAGQLLRAAQKRWPDLDLIGCDIDPISLKKMRSDNTISTVCKRNVLDPKSRSSSKKRITLKGQPDMALINPPFSGIKYYKYTYDNLNIKLEASKAMIFLLDALSLVKPGGIVAAILPSGSTFRRNDAKARSLIDQIAICKTIQNVEPRAFPGVDASTVIAIYKKRKKMKSISTHEVEITDVKNGITVSRGYVSPSKASTQKSGVHLVHTTNMQHNKIENTKNISPTSQKVISGPSVLLQRVGRPNKEKVILCPPNFKFIPSDCLIVIQCPTVKLTKTVYNSICRNWNIFSKLYVGTGAKFITIEKVKKFVASLPT